MDFTSQRQEPRRQGFHRRLARYSFGLSVRISLIGPSAPAHWLRAREPRRPGVVELRMSRNADFSCEVTSRTALNTSTVETTDRLG